MKGKRKRLPGRPRAAVLLDGLLVESVDPDSEVLLSRLGDEDPELGAAARLGKIPLVLRLIRRRGRKFWNLVVHLEDDDGPEIVLGCVERTRSVRAVNAAADLLGWHRMGLFVGKPRPDGTWTAR